MNVVGLLLRLKEGSFTSLLIIVHLRSIKALILLFLCLHCFTLTSFPMVFAFHPT